MIGLVFRLVLYSDLKPFICLIKLRDSEYARRR